MNEEYNGQEIKSHHMLEGFFTAPKIEDWMIGTMLELENWIAHFKGIYITYKKGLPHKIQTKYKVPFIVTKSSQRQFTLWKPRL